MTLRREGWPRQVDVVISVWIRRSMGFVWGHVEGLGIRQVKCVSDRLKQRFSHPYQPHVQTLICKRCLHSPGMLKRRGRLASISCETVQVAVRLCGKEGGVFPWR